MHIIVHEKHAMQFHYTRIYKNRSKMIATAKIVCDFAKKGTPF